MRDPIPHVQPGPVNLAQLAKELNQLHVALEANSRLGLKQRIRMGKVLLQVQQQVGPRQMTAWCQANFQGSMRTAVRRMTEARRTLTKSIDLMTMDELDGDVNEQIYPRHGGVDENTTPSPTTTSEVASEPPDFTDSPPPSPAQCSAPRSATPAPHTPPPPSREPGDDTDQLAADQAAQEARKRAEKDLPKPGAPLFDWKRWQGQFGPVVRSVDQLAGVFGFKGSEDHQRLEKKLKDFHDDFHRVYRDRITH